MFPIVLPFVQHRITLNNSVFTPLVAQLISGGRRLNPVRCGAVRSEIRLNGNPALNSDRVTGDSQLPHWGSRLNNGRTILKNLKLFWDTL